MSIFYKEHSEMMLAFRVLEERRAFIKAVIQIYRNLKILGYCKVARSQDVGYLFDKSVRI